MSYSLPSHDTMASQHITTNLLRLRLRRLLDLDRVALRVVLPKTWPWLFWLSRVIDKKLNGLFQGKSPEMDDDLGIFGVPGSSPRLGNLHF